LDITTLCGLFGFVWFFLVEILMIERTPLGDLLGHPWFLKDIPGGIGGIRPNP
jgi:hypothetical protein